MAEHTVIFSPDEKRFIQSVKSRGGRIALLRPETGSGYCDNCAGGYHLFELIVGGPDEAPARLGFRAMPWCQDPVSVTATNIEGKWYQRVVRSMVCPVCHAREPRPESSPPPDDGRKRRAVHVDELLGELKGFNKR